jgi:hypothetical protein
MIGSKFVFSFAGSVLWPSIAKTTWCALEQECKLIMRAFIMQVITPLECECSSVWQLLKESHDTNAYMLG